jgi:hypothetical protein
LGKRKAPIVLIDALIRDVSLLGIKTFMVFGLEQIYINSRYSLSWL